MLLRTFVLILLLWMLPVCAFAQNKMIPQKARQAELNDLWRAVSNLEKGMKTAASERSFSRTAIATSIAQLKDIKAVMMRLEKRVFDSTMVTFPEIHRVDYNRVDVRRSSTEIPVYVVPAEPTRIEFEREIEGGFKRKNSAIGIQRQKNVLIIFAHSDLSYSGESILVKTKGGPYYAIRVMPETEDHSRDVAVHIEDIL